MQQLNQLFERLGKLTRAQRMLVFGAVYALMVVAWFFLMFGPISDERESLEGKHAQLQKQKDEVEAQAINKEKFEQEVQRLLAEFQTAIQELPIQAEMAGFLKSVSVIGKRAGLEFKKWVPQKESAYDDLVMQVPVSFVVEGNFHEVAMFFDRLSRMHRIVSVKDIEMRDPEDRAGKIVLEVSGSVVTFRFMSDQERQAAKEGSGDSKRGKKKKAAKEEKEKK